MKRKNRIEILLTDEEMERVEKIAKKLNMPKGRLIRKLAMAGLEDAELLNKLGLFDIVKMIEKIRERAFNPENKLATNS
jgi:predicted DNA-binding protein